MLEPDPERRTKSKTTKIWFMFEYSHFFGFALFSSCTFGKPSAIKLTKTAANYLVKVTTINNWLSCQPVPLVNLTNTDLEKKLYLVQKC